MTQQETKRTYTISTSMNPAISGYGGFDEWEIILAGHKADKFFQALEKLIKEHGGQFTGSN